MKKATVILGAGASAGVWNGVTPVSNAAMQPPVARELFEERFWTFQSRYRGAEVLGAQLGPLARRSDQPFDLETRLTRYRDSPNPLTQRAFKDIPLYLRDVLIETTRLYVPSPSNYIRLAAGLLGDQTHEVMFLTLNYDTMLEEALAKYSPAYTYTKTEHHTDPGRQARVAKLHGSTSWGFPLPGTSPEDLEDRTWDEAVRDFQYRLDEPLFVSINAQPEPSRSWRDPESGRLLYPALTAPVTDKTFCCPYGHVARVKEFLKQSHKFLVIGTSGVDQDLLGLLSETSSPDRGNVVYFVNSTVEEVTAMRTRFEAEVTTWKPSGPQKPLPQEFVRGFSDFLDTPGIDAFLAAD